MADIDLKLSLKNAKWAAEQLKRLSPQARAQIMYAQSQLNFPEFERVAIENGILNTQGVWEGINDIRKQTAAGVNIPISSPKAKDEPTGSFSGSASLGTAAGAAALLFEKKLTHEEFKKNSEKNAEKAAEAWDKEEEKYQKNPKKKRDPSRPTSRQDAYDRAIAERHDLLLAQHGKLANKWASENPADIHLAQSIDRHEMRRKDLEFNEFDDIRKRYVKRATQDFDQRDPFKRAGDRSSAIQQSHHEIHDRLVLNSPKAAKEWAQKYNDPDLYAAIERKRLRDEATAIQKQNRISKALGRNPTANIPPSLQPTQAIQPNRTAWTPIPVNTFPGTLPPNTFKNQGAPNTAINAQTPATQQPPKGLRKKLTYYSPGQIRNRTIARAQNRIINSKIGQRFQKTRLGRISSRLNRISRKLKNLINPLQYLINLFKKSLLGSLASGISSAIGSLISAIATTIVSVGSVMITISSLLVTKIGTGISLILGYVGTLPVSLPLAIVLALLIFIGAAAAAILSNPENPNDPPQESITESPYAGISYYKIGPREVNNGENITYDIGLIYDSSSAKCKLENITFIDSIPPRSTLVEGAGLTTGAYTIDSDPEPLAKWKLTNNLGFASGTNPQIFSFKLTIDPEDDVTITNRIYIEGCAAEISTPDDSGDLFEGANSLPTTNDCGNSNYADIMGTIRRRFGVTAANFGDPLCNFSLDKLKNVLERFESDPEKVDFFMKIAQCESVANGPNGYGSSNNTWGHFQMDSHYSGIPPQIDPFKPWREENNTKGDVPWQRQAQNAVSYNNLQASIKNNFETWQTAYCFCYYPKYRNNRKLCGDIEDARKIQTPSECNNSCVPRIVND